MNNLRNKITSKLANREPPHSCLMEIGDHEFDDLVRIFKEICEEKGLEFVLLPPMFPMEMNKLRCIIEKRIDIHNEIVMLCKTDQIPHFEAIVNTLEPNMFLFVVHTEGIIKRGVWEVIK